MPSEAEVRAAAMELWRLLTAPGDTKSDWERWMVPAARALEAAEKYRAENSDPH